MILSRQEDSCSNVCSPRSASAKTAGSISPSRLVRSVGVDVRKSAVIELPSDSSVRSICLTRPIERGGISGMKPFKEYSLLTAVPFALRVAVCFAIAESTLAAADSDGMQKWQKGKGWGWVWDKDDEVGAFNEMTDSSRLAALHLVKEGKVYDLGVTYDRTSYK